VRELDPLWRARREADPAVRERIVSEPRPTLQCTQLPQASRRVSAEAIDALLADPYAASDAVYTPEGGNPATVRAVLRPPDTVTGFGNARVWSETTRADLRVGEVPRPRPEIESRSTVSPTPSTASRSATPTG
jgi:hypothetical protein